MVLGNRGDQSHNALMAMTAGQLRQALAIGFDHAHTRVSGLVDELTHAGVTASDLEMDFNNGLGGDLEANANGVKAEKHFVG
jgi:hypothetical protein